MRILMISPSSHIPSNTGATVRISNLLQGLSKNHFIDFYSPIDKKIYMKVHSYNFSDKIKINYFPKKYNQYIPLLSNNPYHVSYYFSEKLNHAIKSINFYNYDLVYLNFIYPLIYFPINITIPIVVDQQNVDHIYWERKLKTSKNPFIALVNWINLKKTIKYEKLYLKNVSCIVSVSKLDKEKTAEFFKDYRITYLITPNGVDIDKFLPKPFKELKQTITIGYLGSFDLEINQNAAALIIQKIIPEIRKIFPENKINGLMIGRNPPGKLLNLTNHDPLISFTGTIDDPSEYLKKIDIFVGPIIGGGGTKLKLFEAMASGIPTVGTKYLYEGVNEIENGIHALIAENEEEITKKICLLINDETLYRDISINGRKLIEQYYSWKEITNKLSEQLEIIRNL